MKNIEIERCISILNEQTCFRFDTKVKQPPKIRFAIRKNLEMMVAAFKDYDETRRETIEGYVSEGIVKMSDDQKTYVIKDDHVDDVTKELLELGNIEVDLNLHQVDEKEMDNFLQTIDISTPEEDVLLLFVKEE